MGIDEMVQNGKIKFTDQEQDEKWARGKPTFERLFKRGKWRRFKKDDEWAMEKREYNLVKGARLPHPLVFKAATASMCLINQMKQPGEVSTPVQFPGCFF